MHKIDIFSSLIYILSSLKSVFEDWRRKDGGGGGWCGYYSTEDRTTAHAAQQEH